MIKQFGRCCGLVVGVVGVVGVVACGAADSGDVTEVVGAAEQALNGVVSSSPSYPARGVSYDGITTSLNNTFGDWDRFGIISPRSFRSYGSAGSGAGFYGMNCDYSTFPFRDFLRGVSARGDNYGHSAKCTHTVNGSNFPWVMGAVADGETRFLSRVAVAGSTTNIDDKLGSDVTWNWDTSAHSKAECRAHYVAVGIAQIETGEVDALRCQKVLDGHIFNVSKARCSVSAAADGVPLQVNSVTSNCPGNNCSGANDWEPGFAKTTCTDRQYIKGVSKRSDGKIKSILCCSFE